MPEEQADNTRVVQLPRPQPIMLSSEEVEQLEQQRIQQAIQQDQTQLWDADKVEKYRNMQNLYNNSFWGYGVGGKQTNYDPYALQGRTAIQSNFDYTQNNLENFANILLTAGAGEGTTQAIRWAITPTKIGQGAEAVVSSVPLSTRVTKITTIPRSEMHARNTVPGALKSRYVKTSNGLTTYTQPKVNIISKEQLVKASKTLEKIMSRKGWRKITHPNLQGTGYTNGRLVTTDIGPGNVGRDWLGRVRLVDFSLETVPQFRLAMQKRGGKLISKGQDGLSAERKLDVLKHTYRSETIDKDEMIPVTYDARIESYNKYPELLDSDFDYYINKGNGIYIPTSGVEVTAYRPLHLITYYPIIHSSYNPKQDIYPWTGHSQIVGVCSKGSDDKDYNLITNNCSDETREYLEAIFKKELKPFLFTTPGDVRDFAIDNGGYSRNNGRDIFIPMNKERWEIVRNLRKRKSKEKFNKN